MLSARTMGSQGHQNLPFGYDPSGIHGIGLPSFITPPGQPLLSEQENEQMQDFFSTFDGEGQPQGQPNIHGHIPGNIPQLHHLQMPQTYVGHETYVRSPQTMEWHPHSMNNNFQFQNHMNMSAMHTPTSPYPNGHVTSPVNQLFPMHHQGIHNYNNGWQQQTFPNHSAHGARADMHFGSDPNFLNSGYVPPDGSMEPDVSLMQYAIAPTTSASNTQPNSRPSSKANTEPSSPIATKKRKINVFQTDSLRMTSGNGTSNGVVSKYSPPPPTSARKERKSVTKNEQPPTPLSKTPTVLDEDEIQDEDAEYDEDEENEPVRSASPPAPWPSSKARPLHKPPPPPKPPKPRRKSQPVDTPTKPKARRASSSANAISRVPLTAEQKKANHTNSEQRRRDATARAYAELYDLVPELDDMGKQSTMKRLEVVVDKARDIKERVEYIRSIMGRDPSSGRIIPGQIAGSHFGGDMSHLSGWR